MYGSLALPHSNSFNKNLIKSCCLTKNNRFTGLARNASQ